MAMAKYMITAAFVLCAAPLFADDGTPARVPMSAAEFEAYTTGKTLSYARQGSAPYGAEQYLPGRRVLWAFNDDECNSGRWHEDLGLICFVYEDNPTPQCWSFFRDGGRITALFENVEGATALYEIGQSNEPLFCPGPQVGV